MLRYVAFGGSHDFVWPELLLRHRSPVGPLTFGQRLSLERSIPLKVGDATTAEVDGQTWARLRLDLEKLFPLGGLTLRPRLSAEAATHLRLQKKEDDPDERTIQSSSLRAEVGLRFSDHFDLTPWFAYQTVYLQTLPQYDALGNQTSGGKLNVAIPTVGLELRYTVFQGKEVFERQQLPTQH